MSDRRLHALAALTIAGIVALGVRAGRAAPPGLSLPVHWNLMGEADRWADTDVALAMPALLTTAVSVSMVVLSRIDPGMGRSRGLRDRLWIGLLAFCAAIEAVIAPPLLGVPVPPTAMLVAVGLLLATIGDALPKSRPGFFLGIRTPWALIDTDNWIATHRVGGHAFVAAGLVIAVVALVPLASSVRALLTGGALTVAVAAPVVASFLFWRAAARG